VAGMGDMGLGLGVVRFMFLPFYLLQPTVASLFSFRGRLFWRKSGGRGELLGPWSAPFVVIWWHG
jgi:hypothetical protein